MNNSYNKVKNLLSKGNTNSKTIKNELETYILYLAPSNTILTHNVCPFASEGCKKGCLYTSGMGKFSNVQESRINKTKFWAYDREKFYLQLWEEISKINKRGQKNNKTIAIRLNGTSDIDHLDLIKRYTNEDVLTYSNLIFYDYTKNPNHIKKYLNSNYKLTFSRSETNDQLCKEVLNNGGNVAMVFKDSLPSFYDGYKVINGDETDLRYFDPKNVIIGLIAKGDAKKDTSGFVINL